MKPSTTSNPESKRDRSGRRSFFIRLLAAVGGGLATGSILHRIVRSRAAQSGDGHSVTLITHPLAVPRSKEGPQSNV